MIIMNILMYLLYFFTWILIIDDIILFTVIVYTYIKIFFSDEYKQYCYFRKMKIYFAIQSI